MTDCQWWLTEDNGDCDGLMVIVMVTDDDWGWLLEENFVQVWGKTLYKCHKLSLKLKISKENSNNDCFILSLVLILDENHVGKTYPKPNLY